MKSATMNGSDPRLATAPEMAEVRCRALAWVDSMAAGGTGEYRLHAAAEPTVFASCFAVFLRRLLNDLDRCTGDERAKWLRRLLDLQDQSSGLFIDPANESRACDAMHDARHLNMQLTTFCVGAVHALGGTPLHRLAFLDECTPGSISTWLDGLDWREPWNCGNKAMFLGICLAYEAERTGDAGLRRSLDAWFDWHDDHQDRRTGFWGKGVRAGFIEGLGGAYHQFTVYNYAGRPIRYADRIVDRTLLVQAQDGMYSPYRGGATCYDQDAADVLVHMYAKHDYRRREIRTALRRMLPGVLSMQNPDGGFCWGRWRPHGFLDACGLVAEFMRHRSPAYLYMSVRAAAAARLKGRPVLRVGWACAPRGWSDSSIFDTWFRLVTIAEISTLLADLPYSSYPWQFLTVPGLGWFPAEGLVIPGDALAARPLVNVPDLRR